MQDKGYNFVTQATSGRWPMQAGSMPKKPKINLFPGALGMKIVFDFLCISRALALGYGPA